MWIQVRSMDGRKNVRLDDLSKLTKIEDLREKLVASFGTQPSQQRLFYRGKQLVDGHTLFDYDVGLNDIIQIFVPQQMVEPPTSNGDAAMETDSGICSEHGSSVEEMCDTEEGLYKVGEKVDAKDLRMGAWFEAQVVKVTVKNCDATEGATSATEQVLQYHVKYDDYDDDEPVVLSVYDVRPRACTRVQFSQLSVGSMVMVNYNHDHPSQRGYWYDALITLKSDSPRKVRGKIILDSQHLESAEECPIKFIDDIFAIPKKLSPDEETNEGEMRIKKPDCDYCKDNMSRQCKYCACSVCGGKHEPDKQLLCDECDSAFHIWCLDPPLDVIPDTDEWYCSECKTDTSEVIGAGEKLRLSKKKANMQSKKGDTTRDWGKGMACVGRTKTCTIVPSNHFGPIPGIPVGTMWKFRVQVSESGVHRPHVAGIHGRESEGAYSIVLSGGYEDDKDNGVEFVYSGSGGRDLSGNKRTAKQSMDQKLTAMNKALAKNCNAPIDDKNGAEATDWKRGKPVRVVRNHKGSKASRYCPKEGNRYDGIYKVAKYWPQKNKDGLLTWKYLLKRDDETPGPWTAEGKKLTKKLGLSMQYPDGYLEATVNSHSSDDDSVANNVNNKKRKSNGVSSLVIENAKQPRYELSKLQKGLIRSDTINTKLWTELLGFADSAGSVGLLSKIQESFTCIVCQELVYKPVSTPCLHNICKTCLNLSFKAEVFTCPCCRYELGKDFDIGVNGELQAALLELFPGYDGGR